MTPYNDLTKWVWSQEYFYVLYCRHYNLTFYNDFCTNFTSNQIFSSSFLFQ